jgi:hypothetical protein
MIFRVVGSRFDWLQSGIGGVSHSDGRLVCAPQTSEAGLQMPLTLGSIVKSVNCQKQQARHLIANISANPQRNLRLSAERRVAEVCGQPFPYQKWCNRFGLAFQVPTKFPISTPLKILGNC